jgi:LysR family transcriptional regulator, hydrogen peroxide-inducible genes activator
VITTVAPYLLPIALPGLAEALPQTPLYLVEDLTDRLLARLRDGALDAAIIATDPRDAKLMSIDLYNEPFFLVFSGHAKKRGRVSIGVEEIDPSTLLLLAEGHCLRDQALALCQAAERTALGADVRGTSLETLRHLASAGQGATLAPLLAYADWRRSGARIAGLKIVGDGASRLVRLVFKRGSAREAALEALAASLQSTGGAALAKCLRETERDSKRA